MKVLPSSLPSFLSSFLHSFFSSFPPSLSPPLSFLPSLPPPSSSFFNIPLSSLPSFLGDYVGGLVGGMFACGAAIGLAVAFGIWKDKQRSAPGGGVSRGLLGGGGRSARSDSEADSQEMGNLKSTQNESGNWKSELVRPSV